MSRKSMLGFVTPCQNHVVCSDDAVRSNRDVNRERQQNDSTIFFIDQQGVFIRGSRLFGKLVTCRRCLLDEKVSVQVKGVRTDGGCLGMAVRI
jgi:hypothetical protein